MEHSYIHFKIDKELKTELQIIALKQNTTITQLLTDYIQSYVDENKQVIIFFIHLNTTYIPQYNQA